MTSVTSGAVVVLGASGFVGGNLAERVAAEGIAVLALSRKSHSSNAGMRWVDASGGVGATLRRILSNEPVAAIIHAAGRINASPRRLEADNVGVTEALMDALDSANVQPRIVYISSVSAAGPLGDYGAAKRRAEDVLSKRGANAIILRPSLIYGPGERANVGVLVRAVRHWPAIPVPGGKDVKLQPLFIDDLSEVVVRALANTAAPGCYIVAGPRQERLYDMVQIIEKKLGRCPPLFAVPLGPIQIVATVASRLAPGLPVPLQQIASLHNHPAWLSEEAFAAFGFAPRTFELGVASYL